MGALDDMLTGSKKAAEILVMLGSFLIRQVAYQKRRYFRRNSSVL
jgi:hypothetical protein